MSEINSKLRDWSYQRQCLGKQGTTTEQVLKNIIAVYSSHPTAPLSLFARVQSLTDKSFFQLDTNQLAIRIPAMRLSAFMFPKETAHFSFSATVPAPSDPVWEKRYSQKGRQIDRTEYENYKKQILQIAQNPLTAKELKQKSDIPDDKIKLILNRMGFEGILLRIGAQNLRSNLISYVSTRAWLQKDLPQVENEKALAWLAGEYFRVFGPARIKDFQWWAGISATNAKLAVSKISTVCLENDLLLLKIDLNDFENFKYSPSDKIDLLPQWDSYTMGYAPDGRKRFVSTDMQDKIYGKLGATGGNALGTILVNGFAHGFWSSRFKGEQMIVDLNMFEKPSAILEKDLRNQFEEIAVFLKAKSLKIENES